MDMTQETTALPPVLNERVSSEIRAELGRQRMTQLALAEKIGMQPAILSKRLGSKEGFRSFTLDELDAIASALGVPVERLIAPPAPLAAGAA